MFFRETLPASGERVRFPIMNILPLILLLPFCTGLSAQPKASAIKGPSKPCGWFATQGQDLRITKLPVIGKTLELTTSPSCLNDNFLGQILHGVEPPELCARSVLNDQQNAIQVSTKAGGQSPADRCHHGSPRPRLNDRRLYQEESPSTGRPQLLTPKCSST